MPVGDSCLARALAAGKLPMLKAFDQRLREALRRGRIPGAGVAVVHQGELVFAQGYGRVSLEAGAAEIDMRTHFPVASTIKAMTSTLLGMLVDEGSVGWDVPVRDYLPGFSLADPEVSRQVTLRDLLAMRTGLPAHEVLWMTGTFDRAELVRRMPHLGMSAGFREKFQYNNLNYAIAGHIAEVVTGLSFERLMTERLFRPLGMDEACFGRPGHANVVTSYHETWTRALVATEVRLSDMISPAGGSIYATLQDMVAWLRFNLTGGKASGTQLIAPDTLKTIWTPQISMSDDPAAPSPGADYALGWFIDAYQGTRRISHTGYLDDVNSCVTLIPDEQLGIVSFTTFASSRLAMLINEQIVDAVSGRRPLRTFEDAEAAYEHAVSEMQGIRLERTAPVERSTDPDERYAGVYRHAGYGEILIVVSGHSLILHWGGWALSLVRLHDEVWIFEDEGQFEIHKSHPFDSSHSVSFTSDENGKVSGVALNLEPAVAAVEFQTRDLRA
jgi:CubicO group peptidase (beta-lactamase class C family)